MYSKTIAAALLFISFSCKPGHSQMKKDADTLDTVGIASLDLLQNSFASIAAIPAPEGFTRTLRPAHSFPAWLGQVRLKKDKTVYLFDGREKPNQLAQFAVLDIPVGNKNLQQCADAVMRLRASYLFDEAKFDSILFYDNERNAYRFTTPYTLQHLDVYLQEVFGMCGTASLAKQLKKINQQEIMPGDVLIRGGFPGHAVIVVDMVVNKNGLKKYMLAQSYMPAQNIHILLNPAHEIPTSWYELSDTDIIQTPEYTFHSNEWKRW